MTLTRRPPSLLEAVLLTLARFDHPVAEALVWAMACLVGRTRCAGALRRIAERLRPRRMGPRNAKAALRLVTRAAKAFAVGAGRLARRAVAAVGAVAARARRLALRDAGIERQAADPRLRPGLPPRACTSAPP